MKTLVLILAITLNAQAASDPCSDKDPAAVLRELSLKLKKEAARVYLRLDWNGTSVTPEQYDKMIETNKAHYDEDPNLRMVQP